MEDGMPGRRLHAALTVRVAGGFSLIELLVTMAVLAIIATMAMPSLMGLVNSNRLAAQSNELVASLQTARMEAIRRNASVNFCRSENGTACSDLTTGSWSGWLVVLASDGEILRAGTTKPPLQISSADSTLSFRPDGLARDSSGQLVATSFVVCIAKNEPAENRRAVAVASGSRISTRAVAGGGTCP